MIDLPAPPGPVPTPAPPTDPVERAARRQAILLALLGPIGIWVVGIGLLAMVASSENLNGQCEGIGWGCTINPRDTVLILGVLGGVTVVPVVTAVTSLCLLLKDPWRRGAIIGLLVLLGFVMTGFAPDVLAGT